MTKKLLMIAFPAVLATMMLLGSVTGASLNQEVFAAKGGNEKVDICHNTSSEKNPQVTINVSVKAVDKHLDKHGDFVGTCEDGPDCEHDSNSENPECRVSCPDCQAEYEAAVEQCEPTSEICLKEADINRQICIEKNEGNPECNDPCPDCDAEWAAALLECDGEKVCTIEANDAHDACLKSNAENPECTDPCVDCQDAYAADVDECLADGYNQNCLDEVLKIFQGCLFENNVEPNSCQVTPPPTPCEDCQAAYETNVDACIGEDNIPECLADVFKKFQECLDENKIEPASCQVTPQPTTCQGCQEVYTADIIECKSDLICYKVALVKFMHCSEFTPDPTSCKLP